MSVETFNPEVKSNQPFGFELTGMICLLIALFLPFVVIAESLFYSRYITGFQLGFLSFTLLSSVVLFGVSSYVYKKSDTLIKLNGSIGLTIFGIVLGSISILTFYLLNPVTGAVDINVTYYSDLLELFPYSYYSFGFMLAILSQVLAGIALAKKYSQSKQIGEGKFEKINNSPLSGSIFSPNNSYERYNANLNQTKQYEPISQKFIPKFCGFCGYKMKEYVKFCPNCGTKLK